MGCDPCWICRRSYPTSLSLTSLTSGSSGGSSGGSGAPDTNWIGCCGNVAGTYVPATPHGQDVDIDNGVTIHRTFKAPFDFLGSPFPSCGASWSYKVNTFNQGMAQNPLPPYEYTIPIYSYGIVRCQGADNNPIFWEQDDNQFPYEEQARDFTVEFLSRADVNLSVGNWPFATATIAAGADSTRVNCTITERFLGYTRWATAIGGEAFYDVTRIARYSGWLPKPCPESGTFTLPHFGTTFIEHTLFSAAGDGTMAGTWFDFASYPACVAALDPYAVEITI